MFIVRLAGDVDGEKRNIEVTFAARPSLQLLFTVAESVLPLRGHRLRRPWHPPGAATSDAGPRAGVTTASESGALVPVGPVETSPLAERTSTFTVGTLVYLDRATRTWVPLYSASQISTGAQVYCFPPLQHRRVPLAKRDPSAAGAAVVEGGKGEGSPRASCFTVRPTGHADVGPSVVPGWRDAQVDTDRPGVIPPPQHRLTWDDAASRSERGRPSMEATSPASSSALPASVGHAQPGSTSSFLHTPDRSRGARLPSATFSSDYAVSPSPLHASAAAPAAASPAASAADVTAASGWMGAARASGSRLRAVAGLVRSLSPSSPETLHEHRTGTRHATREADTLLQASTSADALPLPRPLFQRRSADAACREEPSLLAHVTPAWSALLRGGDDDGVGGARLYAHLGERATLVFDVLLRFGAHETALTDYADGGAARRYLLLRDFFLLASHLADVSFPRGDVFFGDAAARATAVPAMDVTAQLGARFHWTWDDLVRHADRDCDGCVTFQEWMSFSIEHPAVVRLVGRAVHALLMREAVSTMKHRSNTPSSSYDRAAEPHLLAPPRPSSPSSAAAASSTAHSFLLAEFSGSSSNSHHRHHHRLHQHHARDLDYPSCPHTECAAEEGECGPDATYPCRVHPDGPVQDGVPSATTVEMQTHSGVRCEACRELLRQAPASFCHRHDAVQPHRFPETLRR